MSILTIYDSQLFNGDDVLLVSAPFSYSCKRTPKDAEDQLEAISGAAFAIKKSHGTHYTVSTMSLFTVVIGHAECPRRERYVRHYIGQSNEQFSGNRCVFMQWVRISRAPGNLVDWMYKKMGVKYSFAAHLRDTGTVSLNPNFLANPFSSIYPQYGFALPEQWIRPVGEETARMIEYLADFISVVGKECQ